MFLTYRIYFLDNIPINKFRTRRCCQWPFVYKSIVKIYHI